MGRVIVIGGGAIGAASAHCLVRAGWEVCVVEKGRFGGGCSHGNCGLISPSHALPLATPGAVAKSLRMLARRNAPLRVGSWWDPELVRWLWSFSRFCRKDRMLASARALNALLQSSVSLYEEWRREERQAKPPNGDAGPESPDCEWEDRGCLFVFRTREEMQGYAKTDLILREFGLGARRFDGEAVVELEPALKPGLAGGWLYEGDSHMRPDRLMDAWRRGLETRGVRIVEGRRAGGFVVDRGRASAVETDEGPLDADAFVLAAGAVLPEWNRALGVRLPIQPGKGYSLTTSRPTRCPTIPMIFQEDKVAVTPMRSAYRLGSMMELVGYDSSIPPARIRLLRDTARRYLHDPWGETTLEEWYGWRPMVPDGVPTIGPAPAIRNVIVAAGHGMLGMSMAPATGKLVAELVAGSPPHVDPAPYSLARFGRGR